MKHFLVLMALCVPFASMAQVTNDAYDPDADGDNNIGVNDILALLSFFGENDTDDDGIWDSVDDCLADSCQFKAYCIVEPLSSSQSIVDYIFINHFYDPEVEYEYSSGDWFGFSQGLGNPTSGSFEAYSSFITEHLDSLIYVFQAPVPQVDGGLDEFGNASQKFSPNTIHVPVIDAGNAWFVIAISEEAMGGLDSGVTLSTMASGNSPSPCLSYSLNATLGSIAIENPGGIFPPGTYHLFSTWNSSGFQKNTDVPWYFGGATLTGD